MKRRRDNRKATICIVIVLSFLLTIIYPTITDFDKQPAQTESRTSNDNILPNTLPKSGTRTLASVIPDPDPIYLTGWATADVSRTFGHSIAETSNGEFVACGSELEWDGSQWIYDWWVGRFTEDMSRDAIWFNLYGNPNDNDQPYAIAWDENLNMTIVAGYEVTGSYIDYTLRHLYGNGAHHWTQFYGDGGIDRAWSVIVCDNGDYVSAGYTTRSTGDWDFWVMRHDPNGTKLWDYKYGMNTTNEECHKIAECENGDFLLAGWTDIGTGPPNAWIVRLAENGTHLWNRTYGGKWWNKAFNVIECENGDIAFTGYTEVRASGTRDVWLVRTDNLGNVLLNKTFERFGWEGAGSIVECSDGGFALWAGTDHNVFGDNHRGLWLIRTNSTGHAIWNYTYHLPSSQDMWGSTMSHFIKCKDGGFAAIATYYHTLDGREDTVLLRLPDPPRWVEAPVNQVVEYGDSFQYDLNATGDNIEGWKLNDTHFSIDNDGVITAPSDLPVGVYALQISVNGSFDYDLIDEFIVTVEDATSPVWLTTPSDQVVELGDDFAYALSAYDRSGITDWNINNTDLFSITIDGYLTSDSPLDIGIYYLEIQALDPYGLFCEATISITAEDTVPPHWVDGPSDMHLEFPNAFRYDMNASDISGIDKWWINYTSHFQIDNFGVITNSSLLSIGVYTIQVFVNDTQSNILTGIFTLLVDEGGSPMWVISPTDQFVEFNHYFRYRLQAYDASGIGTWWTNDTTRFTISSTGYVTNVTPLSVGTYGLEVSVSDIWGNLLYTEFSIKVQDTTAPEWYVTPEDQTFEEGANVVSQFYAWDFSGVSHWDINNTAMFAISSEGRLLNLTNLDHGNYNLVLTVYDIYGNPRSVTIQVLILGAQAPEWVAEPSDRYVEFGSDVYYDLDATDFSGVDRWWLGDTTYFTISEVGVITNITALSVGNYDLHAWVSDTIGYTQSTTFTIIIQDTVAPTWVANPPDQVLNVGEQLDVQFDASDLSGIHHYSVSDTTNFSITSEGRLVNMVTLEPGIYRLNVSVHDSYGNVRTTQFYVLVRAVGGFSVSPLVSMMVIIGGVSGLVIVVVVVYIVRLGRSSVGVGATKLLRTDTEFEHLGLKEGYFIA
ncbi:MAG: hypothetical protein RTU30_05540 [Candidatus Thorarchaeota archaeon]